MTHNIKEIKMKDNLIVEAVFYCGVVKDFDVSLLFEKHPEYKVLKEDNTLWQNAELLPQGSGVYFDDEMDLTVEEILLRKSGNTGKQLVKSRLNRSMRLPVPYLLQGRRRDSVRNSFPCFQVSRNVTFQELKALLQILRWKHCAEYAKCWGLS